MRTAQGSVEEDGSLETLKAVLEVAWRIEDARDLHRESGTARALFLVAMNFLFLRG